jgi:ABC-2 type transport system permease protein
MRAALAIASKDWREALRAGWLWWAVLAIVTLALASALTAAVTRAEATRTLAAAESQEAQTWLDQGPRNPHAAAHFSRFAVRPPSALEDVDPGLRAFVGGHVWMEAHLQRPAEARPAEDRADASPLGGLTPSWIVQHLLALFGLAIGAIGFSREREEGRIALLQSHGAGALGLAFGKVLSAVGLTLGFGVVLLAAATAGPWAQVFAGGALYADAGLRLCFWCLAALAYGAIFAVLGVALAAWFSTTRASLLAALALWALSVIVAPRAAMTAAEAIAPAPSPATFVASLRSEVREAMAQENAGHGAPPNATITDEQGRVLSVRGLRLQRGEEIGDAIVDRRYAELREAYARQDGVRARFSVMSPTIAFSGLSSALTGTDFAHHGDFLVQAEAHRRMIIRQLNEDDIYNAGDRGGAYLADRDLWENIPAFAYSAPTLDQTATQTPRDALALAAWLLAAMALAIGSMLFALRRR